MKTRVGKIARIPKDIREELNHRLENGELGTELIVWLNSLPEVQKILAEQFGGRPISNQNLSEWKHGGYQDWQDRQTEIREMMDHARDLHRAGGSKSGENVVGYLGTIIAVELAQTLDRLHHTKNPEARMKIFRKLCMELSRLRADHTRERRLELRTLQAAAPRKQFKANQT